MTARDMVFEVRDAGAGWLVAAVENPADTPAPLPHPPVVGLRAVAAGAGRWRAACRFDPGASPAPPVVPARGRLEWRIGWAEALRRPDGPPPPGDYRVQVAFLLAADAPVAFSAPVSCTVG